MPDSATTVVDDGIDHGTVRGHRQHRRRGQTSCDRCLTAFREDNKKSKPRASGAQLSWNEGLVGDTAPRDVKPVGRACPDETCGMDASEPQPTARMVRVEVAGSREPARWYCPGGCAAYGQALAEIRAIDLIPRNIERTNG